MKSSQSPSSLLHLLLLLFLIFSISTINAIKHPSSSSSSCKDTEFIRKSCSTTRYPDLCMQCLSTFATTVHHSHRQLANAALSVSSDRAHAVSSFISSTNLPSHQSGAIKDCIETLADSVDRLRSSMKEMSHMGRAGSQAFSWHLSNVQTWVSAALTDENTCLDELPRRAAADEAGFRAAVRKKVVEVAQVTSNALALVNRIQT
ncbi:pectinesterase inhibitor 9-like [Dioscorea cayenensis subsp. rotundata]|uniref:Pectinesterase inhibitor 9-like n=1 Tax=Dioscorea cayennensis subsp. rotundata TaxID=55577 RepID=A0AB40C5T8_DIOCR|nr:pectinesterase inhibitor 9-like [Dioscorea cayenensis subsp. rotundata]